MTRREFYILALATFITIVAWVIFDIMHTSSQSELPPNVQQVIEPLSPDFDQEAIELLK